MAAEAAGAAEAGGGEAGGKLVHFDGPIAFTADDLLCATAEIMGKSTYGTVYKATLEDGSEVAQPAFRAEGKLREESEIREEPRAELLIEVWPAERFGASTTSADA